MKFLVLAACLSVSAAQGFFGLQAHPNGAVVPIDEPAVAAARADNFAAKGLIHGAPLATGYPAYAAGYHYSGPLAGVLPLIAHPNGAVVPVDEPAVAAARADHLANFAVAPIAHAVAPVAPIAHAVASPVAAVYDHGYHYSGPLAGVFPLISPPNGAVVPADEPAVAAARADHLASHGVV